MTKTWDTGTIVFHQHRCGEEECREYTGWYLLEPGGRMLSGPGRCQDPGVLETLRQQQHRLECGAVGSAVMMGSALAALVLWMAVTSVTQDLWGAPHTAAAGLWATLTSAAVWRTNVWARRRKPEPAG